MIEITGIVLGQFHGCIHFIKVNLLKTFMTKSLAFAMFNDR